ncbi:MAG: hypothetical protein FWF57_09925 [Defluviitaleaceae bacterium]|nr:hypothetical protein [Defluviitaleaceae bacterium]
MYDYQDEVLELQVLEVEDVEINAHISSSFIIIPVLTLTGLVGCQG